MKAGPGERTLCSVQGGGESIWKLAESPEPGQQWQQARSDGCERIPGKTSGPRGCLDVRREIPRKGRGCRELPSDWDNEPGEESNLGVKHEECGGYHHMFLSVHVPRELGK